jgi:Replication-relaxation
MSVQQADERRLPAVAPAMLAGLYQHRLLSTLQLHALYTPHHQLRWTRRVLGRLEARGLLDRVQVPRTRSLWFLTEYGADTVETAGPRAEPRRRLSTGAQAEGPLRAHTLAVNDVGIAFVRAARKRGDECGPDSWRHEIAHPIPPARGARPAELLVADALLTYLQAAEDGSFVLHQRFIELDRGTARPSEQLASKITRYARLRHYTGAASASTDVPSKPLWRNYYRSFPHLLIVLADQTSERIRQRIHRTLALHQSDPAKDHEGTVPVSFVTLEDLTQQGPFAPIFASAEHPGQPVDWLGQPQPEKG